MNVADADGSAAALAQATQGLRVVSCPKCGWLRAVREALGLSRRAVAQALNVSDAAVRDYEVAEVKDAITLRTMRRTAESLGCELVIALVPAKNRTFAELAATYAVCPAPQDGGEPESTTLIGPDTGDLESHLK